MERHWHVEASGKNCSAHREAHRCCRWPGCGLCLGPSCPGGKPGWSGWCPGDWPPWSAWSSPWTAPPAAPSSPRRRYTLPIRRVSAFPKSNSLILESQLHNLTQDIHPFLHDPLLSVEDGLQASYIHLENVQSVPVQAFDALQKTLFLGQVPHRGID